MADRLGRIIGVAAMAAVLLLSLPSTAQAKEREIKGKNQALGAGHAHSWFRVDAQGRPMAVGVSLDSRCLQSLPDDRARVLLELPHEAAEATGLDHVEIAWSPHGHVPSGVYDKPHFDFHFYMRSEKERAGYNTEEIATRTPQPEVIPSGYVMAVGSFEPGQGVHYTNPDSGEFHGRGFRHTFLFGFYDGRMTFLEPMISMDYLRSLESDNSEVPQPRVYPRQGMYFPRGYSVTYDKKHKRYLIALHDFARP